MGVQINGDTGNVIATKGTFSGDVGIGGSLTYEDVTNIDAVGLITARSGIEIGARPGVAASISVDGDAIFSGVTTIGTPTNGRVDVLDITDGALNATFTRGADTNFQLQFRNHRTSNSPRSGVGSFGVFRGDNDIVGLRFMRGQGSAGAGSLAVTQVGVEKVRVDYTGFVGIGSTQPAKKLTIFSDSGDDGGILVQPNANYANNTNRAYLIVGTPKFTGATTDWGTYGFQHRIKSGAAGVGRVTIDTKSGEAFCVNNSNHIGIGLATPQTKLHVLQGADDGTDGIRLSRSNSAATYTQYVDSNAKFNIGYSNPHTADPTSASITVDTNGYIGINTSTSNSRLHILAGNEGGILIEDISTVAQSPYLEIIGKREDGNTHQSFSGQVFLAKNRTDAKTGGSSKLGTILFGGNHTDASKSNILYAASIAGMSGDSFDSATDMPTDIVFYTGSTGRAPTTNNVSSGDERLRIGSDGKIEVKQNAAYILFRSQGSFLVPAVFQNTGNNTDKDVIEFRGWNNSVSGSISTRVNVTTYSTSSDARLKENIVDTSNGIERVKQLRPVQFNFIDNKEETMDGFLAQETKNVVPISVTGNPDKVDKDGNMIPMGMDNSKLVPILTKALQETITKIETLEAEVAALKSN